MGDGRLNKCKECTKADVRKNYEANIAHFQAYDRQRYRADERRQEQLASLNERMTKQQRKAHDALSNALRDGKIKKADACFHCGSTKNIEGHHVAYDYPLLVTWLCRSCHVKTHREMNLRQRSELRSA